jgi:hypothetical protein
MLVGPRPPRPRLATDYPESVSTAPLIFDVRLAARREAVPHVRGVVLCRGRWVLRHVAQGEEPSAESLVYLTARGALNEPVGEVREVEVHLYPQGR